jgi:hypothetical protein
MSDAREKAIGRLALILCGAVHRRVGPDAVANQEEEWRCLHAAARADLRRDAEYVLGELGLVAVDPALVDAVRQAQSTHAACDTDCMGHEHPKHPDGLCMTCHELIAVGRAVLAQLGAKP